MLRPSIHRTIQSTAGRYFTTNTINSSASTSSYIPALAKGKLIAYDEALNYLSKDKETKLTLLKEMKSKGNVKKEVLDRIEIDSYVNDPETRWRSENNLGDNALPIYRELAEKRWRKDGELAILRVLQMSVVPDLVPTIDPIVDLRITIGSEDIVPGVFVLPEQTQVGFKVEANVYHPESRLYTLLLIDPDVPDELNHSFTTFAHWLIPNIPLDSTNSTISSSALLPYIPPHPQFGTPYHRYTLFLLAQPFETTTNTYTKIDLVEEALEREGMDVRELISAHDLKVVGVNFFRQKWNESVGSIFKQAFPGQEEQKFGPVKNIKRKQYKEIQGMKETSKYSLE